MSNAGRRQSPLANGDCRVVVLVSGSGSNLQSLIDASAAPAMHTRIVAVISNKPNAFALTRAQRAGIATATLAHGDFDTREAFDTQLASLIDSYEPDLIVLAGFMRILSAFFTQKYAGKMLNIHPSLLPKYPGLHTHQRAIDAGDDKAGATVHFVTGDLDAGPAVVQASVPVFDTDTADTLAARVLIQEHRIYPKAVAWFAQGRLKYKDGAAWLDEKCLPAQGICLTDRSNETRADDTHITLQ
ncbi:MAG: phosphoribosylglycinamide formyltransferase [Gammaproteobacteria bacterium]|nr:phosphoribosylglycinamide formyltransferase [Gammaproteobacteria bacterium]MBT8152222.1 phosphoribosylglycinamide formyltransferase [Gammaproteobacteria bacterium]NND39096.1 phosphoribosylglycinamide formyltransferase [Pseudomonadales bacterium]NNM10398.1 phosphoribosylglycinamide formyltransferase [Pseudomonadales bacterium]RZV56066.1 MAG: phosphoribosylglycinamide formyltransferase [Pseudomonadales bacterium]